MLVVYTDANQLPSGQYVPNFKIGDGNNYLINLPFTDDELRYLIENHLQDEVRHITQEEREF